MPVSQHPTDHAQKQARSTNGLCGLGVRKLSARSSLHQAPLSFFHALLRVPPHNLLKKVKIAASAGFRDGLVPKVKPHELNQTRSIDGF